MIRFTVIPKKIIWHLATWQNWCFGQFCHSEIEVLQIAEILAKANTLVIFCQHDSGLKI